MSRAQGAVASGLPQVNLLPPEVRAARGLKVVKRWLAVTVALGFVLAAGLVVMGMLSQRNAEAELALAEQDTETLMVEQEKYAEVPVVLDRLDATTRALEIGMSTEVMWAPYLSAIAATTPEGVSIEAFNVAGATPMVLPNVPVDPLQAESAGTVSFTANSVTVPDTAAWLDGLATIPGFADAWFTSAVITQVEDAVYYTVTATVQFSDVAYAERFVNSEEVE